MSFPRRCAHCRLPGHTINNCDKAISDGYKLNLRFINEPHNENRTLNILQNMTVAQLKLLMHAVGIAGSSFMQVLEDKNIIPKGTSLLRYKEDRIKVMMWYYVNKERPINIYTETNPNPNPSSFDCPICLNSKDSSEIVISNCNHDLCKPCLCNYLNHLAKTNNQTPCCSLCRAEFTTFKYVISKNN